MLTVSEYLGQHADKAAPGELTDKIRANAVMTVEKANHLLEAAGFNFGLRSGWRPAAFNASVPTAAVKSKHMTGQAIDISDDEGELDQWCLDNQSVLVELGLYQEHPASTKGWCHVQIVAPASGRRVFFP